jgi:hypothetical protein
MTSDNYMDKVGFFGKLLEYISSKVYATIGDQKLQIGW